ncbi:MAG: hypothetical protein ACREOC_08135 [Gemmatimonadales bacterium]
MLLLLLVALGTPASGASQQTTERRDRRYLGAAEISKAQVENAFDAVERLRPEYFRRAERPQSVHGGTRIQSRGLVPRSPNASSELTTNAAAVKLAVFVNGTEVGDASHLRTITADLVQEMRYLSGPDAQIQYGPRYAGGALQVVLRQ